MVVLVVLVMLVMLVVLVMLVMLVMLVVATLAVAASRITHATTAMVVVVVAVSTPHHIVHAAPCAAQPRLQRIPHPLVREVLPVPVVHVPRLGLAVRRRRVEPRRIIRGAAHGRVHERRPCRHRELSMPRLAQPVVSRCRLHKLLVEADAADGSAALLQIHLLLPHTRFEHALPLRLPLGLLDHAVRVPFVERAHVLHRPLLALTPHALVLTPLLSHAGSHGGLDGVAVGKGVAVSHIALVEGGHGAAKEGILLLRLHSLDQRALFSLLALPLPALVGAGDGARSGHERTGSSRAATGGASGSRRAAGLWCGTRGMGAGAGGFVFAASDVVLVSTRLFFLPFITITITITIISSTTITIIAAVTLALTLVAPAFAALHNQPTWWL